MLYRRYPHTGRKYLHPDIETNPKVGDNTTYTSPTNEIILPTDPEYGPQPKDKERQPTKPSFLEILKGKIKIEEIILIGLIILLLGEGINDELLIILLIYILLV